MPRARLVRARDWLLDHLTPQENDMTATYRETWTEIDDAAVTAEAKRCVLAAEENASDTAVEDDGYELHSEEWYRVALLTYEFLIDNGVFA